MVVVTAGDPGRRLRELLRTGGALSMLCADTDRAAFSGDGPDIVFLSQRAFYQIACENAAFIVRRKGELPREFSCKNAVAIIDSADPAVLSAVAGRRLPAVTCGLGTSDTLTLSSFTVDSAVISLQRQLTAFDGTPVEPFELPVSFSGKLEPFELLAAAAIFCLMGKQNPLAAAPLWRIPPARGLKNRRMASVFAYPPQGADMPSKAAAQAGARLLQKAAESGLPRRIWQL